MIRRTGTWLSARVGDEIMMMNAETGRYIGVNEVGARVWELIEAPAELNGLCATLVGEFEVEPDACRREIVAFIADMQKQGAIAVDPAG